MASGTPEADTAAVEGEEEGDQGDDGREQDKEGTR
jgi:hypothetical protein